MTKHDVRRALDGLHCLPALPKVVEQGIALASRSPAPTDSVARLVSLDPALTGAVFRLGARPDETAPRPCDIVETVQRCLDEGSLYALLMETALAYPESPQPFHHGYWKHSVATALLAEGVARQVTDVPAALAYVAGLTHDIGRLALSQIAPKRFADFLDWAPADPMGVLAIEQQLFGVDHAVAGKWLAELWRLPRSVVAAIWFHHHPAGSLEGTQYPTRLIDLVALADAAAHCDFDENSSPPEQHQAALSALIARLGISRETMEGIRRNAAMELGARSTLLFPEDSAGRSLQRVVSSALRANMRPHTQAAELRRTTAQLRVLHELEQRLLPGLSLTEIVSHCAEALRQGLEVESGACIVADPSGAFVYGKSWDAVFPLPEDVFVHLETGESSGIEAMGRRCQTALSGLLVGEGPIAWEGGRIVALEERGGVLLAPIMAGRWHIGMILLDAGQAACRVEPAAIDAYAKACATAVLRHRAEERLREQSEELAATLLEQGKGSSGAASAAVKTSLDEWTVAAAHAFDGPVNALASHAHLLMGRLVDPADLRTFKALLQQIRRTREIVSDLLAYATPPEPKLEPSLLNFSLRQFVAARQESLSLQGIAVVEEYADGLPRVMIDRRHFEQTIDRLFANAEDAMAKTGGRITVTTGVSPDRSCVTVRIADTGSGITSEHAEKAFVPFFTTHPPGERSGLGLSVCQGLLRGMGATIALHGEPGAGAVALLTFTSVFHETESPDRPVEIPSANGGAPIIEPIHRPKDPPTILVVDDDDDLRAVICETLRGRGYAVQSAADGYEALGAVASARVDLMLLDVHMPRKDGLAVLSELNARGLHVPAIVMSGFLGDEEAAEAIRMGARSCLRKPFRLEVLLSEIEDALPLSPAVR